MQLQKVFLFNPKHKCNLRLGDRLIPGKKKKKKKEVDLSLNTLVWTFIKISYHHFEMVGKELMFKIIGIITYLFPFASYSVKRVAVRKYM